MMMAMKFSQNAKVTRALTGRSPVRPAADHDLKFSWNAKVTRALTGRSLVRPAADHDFENLQFCKFLCFYFSLSLAKNK